MKTIQFVNMLVPCATFFEPFVYATGVLLACMAIGAVAQMQSGMKWQFALVPCEIHLGFVFPSIATRNFP
jgi:hypothetical protein